MSSLDHGHRAELFLQASFNGGGVMGNDERPARPIERTRVAAAVQLFSRMPAVTRSEEALVRLAKAMPDFDIPSTLVKVASVNQIYATNLYAVYRMAARVAEVHANTPGWTFATVDEVAALPPGENQKRPRRYLSFASKFAHFFVDRSRFPLLDQHALRAVGFHLGRQLFPGEAIVSYEAYAREVVRMREEAELDCSLSDFDKYLWLLGQWLLMQSQSKQTAQLGSEVRSIFRKASGADRELVEKFAGGLEA
jgi:hypothetical protein